MNPTLFDIAKSYFKDKNEKKYNPDKFYLDKIISIGIEEKHSKDILLKIDDEWTLEQHNLLAESKIKTTRIFGAVAIVGGLFLSIYSIFFVNGFSVFFYGIVLTGILTYFYAGNIKARINKNRKIQQLEINRIERFHLNNDGVKND